MSRKASLIGELKARRQNLGWSVKELAERCSIEEKFLADWEHGSSSPRLDAIANWAAALGLKLAVLPAESEARPGLCIDWENRGVAIDGTPIRLTPMEWKALERLAGSPGELVTHRDLYRHLYGEDRPYRSESTAIRVLITKLRRLLPQLRIEAQWGRGYVATGIEPRSPDDGGSGRTASKPAEAPQPAAEPCETAPKKPVALHRELPHFAPPPRRAAALPPRPAARRAEELGVIERFLAERGVTRCPDLTTIERSPLPTLIWDKVKRKWVRPPMPGREAS